MFCLFAERLRAIMRRWCSPACGRVGMCVLCQCESGSGASLGASQGGLPVIGDRPPYLTVRGGMGSSSLTGKRDANPGCLTSVASTFRGVCGDAAVDEAVAFHKMCVLLSSKPAAARVFTDVGVHENARSNVWMAPVRGGSWSFLRRAGVISSKRRAFGGCLGTRRR